MIYRCFKKGPDYEKYGGRGITVCEEWLWKEGFNNFKKWSLKNGYREGLSIDRIDVNGNYEPNNCRWATAREQCWNKRNTRWIYINGEKVSLAKWAYENNIPNYRVQKWHTKLSFEEMIERNNKLNSGCDFRQLPRYNKKGVVK